MTTQEARSILNAARDGKDISAELITEALRVTGDVKS